MPLSWNEIKSRALTFSRTWDDAANEDSQGKPFWIDFFEIFGITDKRVATFELNVKKLGGAQGFVDLFWPGMLLVEQKSRSKSLDGATPEPDKNVEAEATGDKLTSSRIAQKLGLKTAQLLDRATENGYLVLNGDKHAVTPKGEKAGVEFVAKSRFGPYFLWPQDFHPV